MRFLHTADWQMGMKAAHVGRNASIVRDARRKAARRVAELARAERVDFVLVAGDTFEDHAVSGERVDETAEILTACDCPLYILPGNHDPLTAASVWERPVWQGRRNLHVLRDQTPVPVPGGWLLPCPVRDRWSGDDPTKDIPLEPADGVRIGVAHGSLSSVPMTDRSHPIAENAAERARLDYLALGHWHTTRVWGRTAYSGTPEPTRFLEEDSGNVLLVEIQSPGSRPKVDKVRTAVLSWVSMSREVNHEGDLATIEDELRHAADPKTTLVELQLKGLLFEADWPVLRRIREQLGAQFLHWAMDDAGLIPAGVEKTLPAGYFQEVERELRLQAEEGPRAEVARRALMELYRLAHGGEA